MTKVLTQELPDQAREAGSLNPVVVPCAGCVRCHDSSLLYRGGAGVVGEDVIERDLASPVSLPVATAVPLRAGPAATPSSAVGGPLRGEPAMLPLTLARSSRTDALSSLRAADGDRAAQVHDRDPPAVFVRFLHGVGREQNGRAVTAPAGSRCAPRRPFAPWGRGRRSARRERAGPGGGASIPRPRGGESCRPSRCGRVGPPASRRPRHLEGLADPVLVRSSPGMS